MTSDAGDKVAFKLYSDPDRTTLWGTWLNRKMPGPTLDVPIGRSEKASGSVKAYGRIDAGQQSVPPGAYKLSLKSNDTVITYGYVSEGSCDSFKNRKDWMHSPLDYCDGQDAGGSDPEPGSKVVQEIPRPRRRSKRRPRRRAASGAGSRRMRSSSRIRRRPGEMIRMRRGGRKEKTDSNKTLKTGRRSARTSSKRIPA